MNNTCDIPGRKLSFKHRVACSRSCEACTATTLKCLNLPTERGMQSYVLLQKYLPQTGFDRTGQSASCSVMMFRVPTLVDTTQLLIFVVAS